MRNELQPTVSKRGEWGGVQEERIPSREMTAPEQDAGDQGEAKSTLSQEPRAG